MKLLLALWFIGASSVIAQTVDPRIEARRRAREAEVERAGVQRALSKEMPQAVRELPSFGTIEWTIKELPFVAKGPHAGISGAGMVVADGQLYLMGGFIPAGDETDELGRRTSRWAHRYDLAADRWTKLPDLPARREYTRAVAADGAVYVMGGTVQGKPGTPSADFFRLNLSQTPLQWKTVAPLTIPRSHMAVGRVGSNLIVAGGNRYDIAEKGYSLATIQGVTDVLNLAQLNDGWRQRAPIPGVPRGWTAAAELGEKFYLFGGVTFTASGKETRSPRTRLTETLNYAPAQNQWTRLADAPLPMSGWEADVFQDRYVILVGGASANWSDVAFVYDVKTDRWMRIDNPMPPGGLFNDPGVCIVGNTIYVAGGEGPGGSHFNHFLVGRIQPNAQAE